MAAIGLIFMSLILHAHTPYILLLFSFLIVFTGIDTALPAGTMSVMGSIPKEKAGIGSAMSEMTGQIGAALGIAVLGAIVNRTYLQHIQTLETTFNTEIMQKLQSSIFSANHTLLQSNLPDKLQLLEFVQDGFITGLRQAMIAGGILLFATAIFTGLLLPHRIEQIQTHTDIPEETTTSAHEHTTVP